MNIAFLWEWPINEFTGGVGVVTKVLAKEMLNRGHKVIFIALMTTKEKQRNSELLNTLGFEQDTYPYIAPQYFVEDNLEIKGVAKNVDDILNKNNIQIIVIQDLIYSTLRVIPYINHRIIKILCKHNQPFEGYDYARDIYKDYKADTLKQKIWKGLVRVFPYMGKWRIKTYNMPKYKTALENVDKLCLLSEKFIPRLQRFIPQLKLDKLCAVNNPNTFECNKRNIAQKENLVIIVTRLFESTKNVTDFLKAWKIVEEQHNGWKAAVVGSGKDMTLLKHRAKKMKLETLSFEGYKSDVSYYFERAKMVCVTSWFEGWGMTITEGMTNECVPLIYNTYEAASDIVDDGSNGILIKSCRPKELANRMLELMNNPILLQTMADRASQKAKQYTPEKIVDQWENLFKKLMEKKGYPIN